MAFKSAFQPKLWYGFMILYKQWRQCQNNSLSQTFTSLNKICVRILLLIFHTVLNVGLETSCKQQWLVPCSKNFWKQDTCKQAGWCRQENKMNVDIFSSVQCYTKSFIWSRGRIQNKYDQWNSLLLVTKLVNIPLKTKKN